MVDRRWIASSGALVVLVGSFLPWLASGTADRSSYDLLGIVDRLGFSPDGLVGWAVRLWPLLPLLLVVTVVSHHVQIDARWLPVVRLGSTAVAALYAGSVALAVRLAPDVGLFEPRIGPWITLAGAILLAISVVGVRRRGWDVRGAS
ncbi:MAG TPA: hypothetical protein VK917_09545 [Ilumatobacter sp.]|nr:hypothetical protein [Ilumatobacter sp.]